MATPRPDLPSKNSSYRTGNGMQGKPKGDFVIELPYSREYIPNSGPTPGLITFVPPADSTAYIIERILLPPDARGKDGKPKPRRPTYIVGWRDTLGARLLVPVMDILDYVSPWEVEHWEMELETELSNERHKLEEEKRREKEALAQPDQPQPHKQPKKKGRRPKNAGIETAAMAELEPQDDGTTRLKGGALSFTPQKAQLEEFVGISDTDGTPSRQLVAEQGEVKGLGYDTEGDGVERPEYFEAEQGVEDETELDDQPDELQDNVVMGFGNAQGEWGSLPPIELQHTMPDEDLAPRPTKVKSRMQPSSQSSVSSWVTAAQSPYKTHASNRPALSVPTAGTSKLSQMVNRSSSQGNGAQWAESVIPPQDSTMPGPKKPRRKSESADKASRPKKRKRESEGQTPVEVAGEQRWIVKTLEDADLYEVEGVGLVRYFKVLWEGDWPADQNPSWEPEDNLPPALVRNFYKRSKDQLTKTQRKKKKRERALQQTTLTWGNGKKCDSVSHAFTGDEDTDLEVPKVGDEEPSANIQDYDEIDDAEDQLLVVDQDQGIGARPHLSGGQRNGIFGMSD